MAQHPTQCGLTDRHSPGRPYSGVCISAFNLVCCLAETSVWAAEFLKLEYLLPVRHLHADLTSLQHNPGDVTQGQAVTSR